jgi:serine/threonine-protein kinase RsbW
MGATEKEVQDSELALVEACNNAILHAGKAGRLHPVLIEASCNASEIQIRVTDHTQGFEMPERAVLPDIDSECGRGLYLIKALVDSVEYRRGAPENTLILRKTRRPMHG